MKLSGIAVVTLTLMAVLITGSFIGSRGFAHRSPAQEGEKSLEIERYPGEPLELVDIKVGSKSLKPDIKTKVRRNEEGLDIVKFKEKSGWHERVSLTLRNVSDRPVIGLRAYLYYKAAGSERLFRLPLEQRKPLDKAPLL